jgi:hypothetical protein
MRLTLENFLLLIDNAIDNDCLTLIDDDIISEIHIDGENRYLFIRTDDDVKVFDGFWLDDIIVNNNGDIIFEKTVIKIYNQQLTKQDIKTTLEYFGK